MRVIVDHSALRTALHLCSAAVNKRDERAILQCVKLTAEGDTLSFAATNINLTATTSADAVARNEGTCAINIDALSDIAKCVSGKVSLELKERNRLEVSAGSMNFRVPALDAADFPTIPAIDSDDDDSGAVELSASSAFPMIRSCSYAETSEDQRYTLAGVLLDVEQDRLTTVATDGHRLATCELRMRCGVTGRVLLPTMLVNAAERLSVSPDGFDVRLSWSRSQVAIGIGRDSLMALRPDVSFPQWRPMIPQDRSRYLIAPTFELVAAAKAVTPFGSGKSHGINLKIWMSVLTLSAASAERGESSANVDIQYDGDGVEVGFTGDYLLDALTNIQTVKTRITLSDVVAGNGVIAKFALIEPEGSEQPFSSLHMVLPVFAAK